MKRLRVRLAILSLAVFFLSACGSSPSSSSSTTSVNQRLVDAAYAGNLSGVRSALAAGANINHGDTDMADRRTALMWAAIGGYLEIARYLVEQGADVNRRDLDGWTALRWAEANDQTAVIEYLTGIERGNERNDPLTALYNAARDGDLDGVKSALENGANINYRDNSTDNTPLLIATIREHYTIAEYLIDNGANVNARNKEGRSALNYVYDKGDMDIHDLLIAHGAREFTPHPVVQQQAPATAPAPSTTIVNVQPSAPASAAPSAPQTRLYAITIYYQDRNGSQRTSMEYVTAPSAVEAERLAEQRWLRGALGVPTSGNTFIRAVAPVGSR